MALYNPIALIDVGVNKDNVHILGNKHNAEIENIYKILNTVGTGGGGYVTYDTVTDMIADTDIKVDKIVTVGGYYSLHDGGAAQYFIVSENTNIPWAIALDNGLFACIDEKEKVNYKQFGALLDGKNDDGPAMLLCHKYADSIFKYDSHNQVKEYLCKVENHTGIIYKKNNVPIVCSSSIDLSGSTIILDDNNATWFGIYLWGDADVLTYDYETPDDMKASFSSDNFVLNMPKNGDRLPDNVILKLEETPYTSRNDSGYTYTADRFELLTHMKDGICSLPFTDDWSQAGGQEMNCVLTNFDTGVKTNTKLFTTYKVSYSYIPSKTCTFTGCDVDIQTSANNYCTVLWCKHHNAIVRDFVIKPSDATQCNSRFKNAIIYLQDCYHITVKNIIGFNAAGKIDDSSGTTATSGYMLAMRNTADVHIEDCNLQGYWGATAFDNVKDVHVKRCHMNRLDVHDYFSNLWAEECTFYNHSIQIGYGRGVVSISNCTFYWNKIDKESYPSSHVIEFNLTYGRMFEGLLTLANCRVYTKSPTDGEFNIFKMEFTPDATSITRHFKMPEIICRNMYIHADDPATHFAYFKVAGTKTAITGVEKPSHVYGINTDNTVIWKYYGRGVNWNGTTNAINTDEVLRVVDTFEDDENKTQFYNIRYYLCTSSGSLDFSGNKPTDRTGNAFVQGTATLKYAPDIIWQSKHTYVPGDLCAANPSNFYPLYLFKCIKGGTSNGYFPTHISGTVLEGTNDSVNEPNECWWTYITDKASWCTEWVSNMAVTTGQRVIAEGRIYQVVSAGKLAQYPPYVTDWLTNSTCGGAVLKFIGLKWIPHQWYMQNSYCEAGGNIYQLTKHDGITTGLLPTRGNPYCVDGDIIWEYKADNNDGSGGITNYVDWEPSTQFSAGKNLKSGSHVYTVQSGKTGNSAPTDVTIDKIIMDGQIPIKCLGEHDFLWRVAGNTYNIGDYIIDNTFVVKCIVAGKTDLNNKWGPVEGAAWTADGTIVDGECTWQRLTKTSDDGVWRNSNAAYKDGLVFVCDGSVSGKVRLYLSLPGTSGTTAPTKTDSTIFTDGTLLLQYAGEAGAPIVDTWTTATECNQNDTVVANNNNYECVFDGKLVLPNKTIFENILTNMTTGHIFWFYKGTDVPTKQGDKPWHIIARNCEAIDNTAEGLTGTVPYFCHNNNPNPVVSVS